MKPFRKNVAIAIDGGGVRGLVVTRALSMLEDELQKPVHEVFRLAVGTSTGSIISAGIACGFSARLMTKLYIQMAGSIFPDTLRKKLFPLARYKYSGDPLNQALNSTFGRLRMGDFWKRKDRTDLVITAYDLQENRTRFIKPWKPEYQNWLVASAVQASCTVPTYFPVFEDRYIDGGVGSYGNPCYVAAYEAKECLSWDMAETTLISIGTGRSPYNYDAEKTRRFRAWNWLAPVLGVFTQSAYDQQVHLVDTYFDQLDFRRFQVDLRTNIEMDAVGQLGELVAYGTVLGGMILNDQVDRSQGIIIKHPGYF